MCRRAGKCTCWNVCPDHWTVRDVFVFVCLLVPNSEQFIPEKRLSASAAPGNPDCASCVGRRSALAAPGNPVCCRRTAMENITQNPRHSEHDKLDSTSRITKRKACNSNCTNCWKTHRVANQVKLHVNTYASEIQQGWIDTL